MSIKRKFTSTITALLKTCMHLFGSSRANLILAQMAEELPPIIIQKTEFGSIKFFCPGRLPEWRARTLLSKEPETIAWINTFKSNDTLWDIGANVGSYTLYAALKKITVLAFEPSPSNYYLLSRNVEINKMDDKISALCIAFNDSTKLDSFFMSNSELGGALNSFGEAVNWQGKPFVATLKQTMLGFSIDDFIQKFNPPFPNHIKIDVDGIENKIVMGAQKTLADKRVKTVLIELDSNREDYCNQVIEILKKAGIALLRKEPGPISENVVNITHNYIFAIP